MLAAFAFIAFLTTFPYPARFTTEVPGDYGDPMFVLWVLRWLPQSALDGWSAIWNAGIFRPGANTLAYSDHFVPLAAIHWPLSRLIGDAAAFNLIYVAAWTSSMFFMYLLGLWITKSWPAAFIGALVYTLATARLSQYGHHQLVIACLFPLLVLLLLRLLERPSIRRGAIVGLVLVVRRGFGLGGECGSASLNLGDDLVGVFLPDERFGVVVPVRDPQADRVFERGDAGECAATQPPVGEQLEPALDEVQPRRTRGREVQMSPRSFRMREPLRDVV